MLFSPASTQPSHERRRKNEGFAYEILAGLIKCLALSHASSLKALECRSPKSTDDVQTDISWRVCEPVCVLRIGFSTVVSLGLEN